MRQFVLCLTLCHFVLAFSVLLALRLPRLGKRGLVLVLFVRLFDLCLFGFFGFLFLWCRGWGVGCGASVCGCGAAWAVLLPFFDKETVRKLLTSVNTSQSQGPDGLHPKLIYELADVICKPLTIIFNKSFETGIVPDEWKKRQITQAISAIGTNRTLR